MEKVLVLIYSTMVEFKVHEPNSDLNQPVNLDRLTSQPTLHRFPWFGYCKIQSVFPKSGFILFPFIFYGTAGLCFWNKILDKSFIFINLGFPLCAKQQLSHWAHKALSNRTEPPPATSLNVPFYLHTHCSSSWKITIARRQALQYGDSVLGAILCLQN